MSSKEQQSQPTKVLSVCFYLARGFADFKRPGPRPNFRSGACFYSKWFEVGSGEQRNVFHNGSVAHKTALIREDEKS